MLTSLLLSFTLLVSPVAKPKNLTGAWETTLSRDNQELTATAIIAENYLSIAYYNKETKTFSHTLGGKWTHNKNELSVMLEFHTLDKEKVGTTITIPFKVKGKKATGDDLTWIQVDSGNPGELNGAWLITGRKRNGEMSRRTPGERKTLPVAA